MSHITAFDDFLKYTKSQREVSLVIAKDEEELATLKEELDNHYFKQAHELPQLLSNIDDSRQMFFVMKDGITKDLYDFIVQYPTGQVEIFNTTSRKFNIGTPRYSNVSLVFLITKDALLKGQKEDFSILEHVGITYQS